MVHMRALLLSLCTVICFSPAVAQDLPTTATLTAAANLEKNVDPQLANWSSLIRNDRYTDAIASVEADLRSGHPNAWAIRYWEALHAADMDAALKAASPDIRQALGQAGEICALEFADKNAELIRRFPPASITTQNPSAMSQLISAATNLGDYATALAYYQKLAPANAESFQAVWEGMDFVDDLRYRPALAQMIAPGGSLAGSSTARFFSLIMQQRPALDLDIAQATNQWLAAHPGDGYALYYLALRWQTIGWRDGARAAAKAAYQAQPIYGDAEIAQLIRDSDFEGAKRIQLQQTRLRGTAEANVEHSLAAAFGSDLIQQGEKGEARKVLAPALKQWPQDKTLLAQMSRLETASKRPAEALRWAELYHGQDATSINPEVVWIKALTAANKPADALAEFNRALPQFPDATPALYGAGMDAAMAMKQYDDYLRIVRDGSAKFPGLAWLQADESLAQHNLSRDEDALATLTKLFDIQAPDTWDVQHYRLYEDAVNGSKGGEKTAAAMLALRQRFPWVEAVWVDLNAHLSGSNVDADRIALWTQAMAGNPDAGWACERKVGALHGMYQFKESEKLVADCLTAARKLSPGTLAEALDNLLWDSSVVEINTQDARTVAQAELPYLQQFRDLTGDTATYYLRHYQVMETLERSHEAAQDLVERVKLQPDSDVFHALWNAGLVKEIGTGHAYRLAQRAVDRDPYNGDRLHDMVELNAQWQGSPINAWVWLLREKEVAPARFANDQRLLGMIYQGLGDTKEHFDKSYVECGCNGIASSGRYVAWYESAVANAQSGTIAAYPPDPDTHAVKLVYPDGTTMLRRDHPLSGNPEMLKVGPVALEIAYDEWGEDMKTVHTPDGQLIEMTYTGDGKLKTVRRSQGPTVEFSYDDKGEPKVRLATDAAIKDASAKAGESKEEDSSAAIHEVTAFLPILNMLESWTRSPRSNTPPEPPNNDPERDRLQDAMVRTAELKGPGSKESVDADTALLAYLIKHLGDSRENAKTAYALIEETDEAATKTDATPQQVRAALDDVAYQVSVLQITRPEGLDAQEWTAWAAKRGWVNTLALSGKTEAPAAQAALASMDAAGLKLMKAARWLPNSYISSQGFWRRYSASDLNTRQMDFRAILVRKNGDVVTGGMSGLTVLHRGFWQTYTFDEARHQLTNDAGALPTAWSNVQAIAETGDETLWVATLEGVYALSGKEYTAPATTVIANADLPCGSVTSLAFGKALVMGTLNGVCVMNAGKPQPVAALAAAPVLFLRAVSADNATVVLAGTQRGLLSIDGSNAEKLDDSTVDDAIWMPAEERLYTLRNRRSVFTAEWKGKGTPGPAAPLDDQQDIVQAGIVHGFTPVSLDEHTDAVAVLTDRGLSIWNDGHFEFQSLPLATREPDVRFGSTAADNSYFVTSEGIYALERGQTMGDTDGRVYDLLAANDLGLTYVARGGGGLEVVDQAHPELGARSLEHVDSTHLARDAAGNLYTNDGLTILMYAPKQTVSRELFTCSENPLDNEANSVTAILAASDGTLWVTAGASVYRWRPGMKEPEEYSIFNRTADEFPAQSDWLWNVVELNDHRIWVIASDEGHLSYKGMAMFGGVVEWAGGKFIRVTMPKDEPGWFIDSYTQIEPGLGILGTNDGFVRQRNSSWALLANTGDPSYTQLRKEEPALYLGTHGARLSDDTWLFGTASGLVGYRKGLWFYPDRINYLLPEDAHYGGGYGVRRVRAVATDAAGLIYAGTERGLLIYDTRGGGSAGFLMSTRLDSTALGVIELGKLEQDADVLLNAVDPKSPAGVKIKNIRQVQAELQQIQDLTSPGSVQIPRPALQNTASAAKDTSSGAEGNGGNPGQVAPASDTLKQQIEAKRRNITQQLLDLERDNRSLWQMLKLDPLELDSARQKLSDDDVLLQYLPSGQELFIHLVSRREQMPIVREVKNVPEAELDMHIERVWQFMAGKKSAGQPGQPDRNVGTSQPGHSDRAVGTSHSPSSTLTLEDVTPDLVWLYDVLLRPVDTLLAGYKHVLVSPVAKLSYVPFAALVSATQPRVQYAVERYNIGYLPSLYMLDLIANKPLQTIATTDLIMANPDGTLIGAMDEAAAVKKLLNDTEPIYSGSAVTLDRLRTGAATARVVHLATHGFLDSTDPGRSYLLMANGERFSVADAVNLDLHQTDVVVLSACETGVGVAGAEYSTLARAFTTGGASTVMATLWNVDDHASDLLVTEYYRNLINKHEDHLTALADAQRTMITRSEDLRQPHMWAGYMIFGSAVQSVGK